MKPARLLTGLSRWLAALLLVLAAGCGDDTELQFEHLELLPAREELVEFPLGRYAIPVPLRNEGQVEPEKVRNRLQLEFLLHALIAPAEQETVAAMWKRHEGMFRDRVIRICRSALLEDLQEPELVVLKTQLLESTRDLFRPARVHKFLVTELFMQEL